MLWKSYVTLQLYVVDRLVFRWHSLSRWKYILKNSLCLFHIYTTRGILGVTNKS